MCWNMKHGMKCFQRIEGVDCGLFFADPPSDPMRMVAKRWDGCNLSVYSGSVQDGDDIYCVVEDFVFLNRMKPSYIQR